MSSAGAVRLRAVPEAASAHPLEPLSAAEIEAAAKSVTAAAGLRPSARFVYVSLYEPAKAEVVAFEADGPAPERLVKVVIRERAERATYEGIVYIQADRPLVDTDVVLWYTFGTNHVVRPEDWPVMPAHPIGFRLVPCGFFAGNPALDNPAPSHCHHQPS